MLDQLIEALRARGLSDDEIMSAIEEAKFKTQLQQAAAQFVRQALAVGQWQEGFAALSLSVSIATDEDGNLAGWQWQLTGQHAKFGSITINGKIDLQAQEPQAQGQRASRSNWARVIELAKRYGVEIRPYEEKAISWYAGVVLTRIAKYRFDAKGDPEFLALVEEWNQTKPKKAPEAKVS